MRLRNHLIELTMSKKTKIAINQRPTAVTARFSANIHLESGLTYEFLATGARDDDLLDSIMDPDMIDPDDQDWFVWEVIFALYDPEHKYGTFSRETSRIDIGKKDALQLFAAIEEVFKEFITSVNPNRFYFTSEDDDVSRIKLYNTLAKKIVQKTGYDLHQPIPSIWEFERPAGMWF